MKNAYMQWFYGKIHNFKLANILANILYGLQILKYKIEIRKLGNQKKLLEYKEAIKLLEKESPCPTISFHKEKKMIKEEKDIDLSIIVPVYNYKDVLRETIDSIVGQKTQYVYEVILVDDGSSDGSEKIVDEYRIYKNINIIHQQNSGIAEARNTGICNSRGRYVMFVDCDDILKDNMVKVMLGDIIKYQSDISEFGFYYFKKQGTNATKKRIFTYPEKILNEGNREILKYPGLPWAKIYKRELFEDTRFPKGFWFEDTLIHFIIFQKCKKISFVNQCLYGYRVYENNYTKVQQKSKRSIEHLWIIKYMIQYANYLKIKTKTDLFYETTLNHLGPILCNGTLFLGSEIHKALFSAASEYLTKVEKPQKVKLNYMLKELENSLMTKNYEKWKLVCKYI